MSPFSDFDNDELFAKLAHEIAEWEHSSYYLKDEELFDLERFLLDHHAQELKQTLEKAYGEPLNRKFWSSSLAYQRLKRAREGVRAMDADQEKRRKEYARALEEGKKDWQQWLKELNVSQRRAQMRVVPDKPEDPNSE
jgi:hypothetical protein